MLYMAMVVLGGDPGKEGGVCALARPASCERDSRGTNQQPANPPPVSPLCSTWAQETIGKIRLKSLLEILRHVEVMKFSVVHAFGFLFLMARVLLNAAVVIYNFYLLRSVAGDASESVNVDIPFIEVLTWTEFGGFLLIVVYAIFSLVVGACLQKYNLGAVSSYTVASMLKQIASYSMLRFLPSPSRIRTRRCGWRGGGGVTCSTGSRPFSFARKEVGCDFLFSCECFTCCR